MLSVVQVKPVKVSGASIRVNFFDFAGGPEYFDIRSEFYKDAQGCLLVYDVSSRETFEALEVHAKTIPLQPPASDPLPWQHAEAAMRARAGLDPGGKCTWCPRPCHRHRWQQIGQQKVTRVPISRTN